MIKVSKDRCPKALDDFADFSVLCQVGRFTYAFCFKFLMIFRCFEIFPIDRSGSGTNVRGAKHCHSASVRVRVDCVDKNFNFEHHSNTTIGRVFIFHMCISYDKTFHVISYLLTLWPWPSSLTYFWKTLTFTITQIPQEVGRSYFTRVFLMTRPFIWYRNILTCDLEVWPTFKKTLTLAITQIPQEVGLSYFTCIFLMTRPFTWYHKCWPCDLDLDIWSTFEKR